MAGWRRKCVARAPVASRTSRNAYRTVTHGSARSPPPWPPSPPARSLSPGYPIHASSHIVCSQPRGSCARRRRLTWGPFPQQRSPLEPSVAGECARLLRLAHIFDTDIRCVVLSGSCLGSLWLRHLLRITCWKSTSWRRRPCRRAWRNCRQAHKRYVLGLSLLVTTT